MKKQLVNFEVHLKLYTSKQVCFVQTGIETQKFLRCKHAFERIALSNACCMSVGKFTRRMCGQLQSSQKLFRDIML